MKRPLILVILLLAVVASALLFVRWVPSDHQAVRVLSDGTLRGYGSGAHLVPPATRLVLYPSGPVDRRFPATGEFSALSQEGVTVHAALELRVAFSPDTSLRLYELVGLDWELGLESVVRDAFEIVTANHPASASGPPAGYVEAIARELAQLLASAGVRVLGYRLDGWRTAGLSGLVEVPNEPIRKVIFVGVDGADWEVLEPLMAEGALPSFRKLVTEGATGRLRSIEPLLSPLLWTTMATGKLPEEHGILNFTVADPETGKKLPISRLYRKVDAFWNLLSDYNRSVDIVGWLATFPAEDIDGVMVTDRVGYLAYADAKDENTVPEGSVSPDERAAEISSLIVRSEAVGYEEFRPFVHVDRQTFLDNRSIAFDPKNPINNMIMLYASTQSYRRIASHLLRADHPDFIGVYFELVDATKHLFMHYSPPRDEGVDVQAYGMFKDAVRQAYVLQDEILGEMMRLAGDGTVLVVASDHGFKSGATRPKLRPEIWAGKAAFWHELDGILCLYGDGIRPGYRIEGATILDITPTFLALQGLPKPADMPGKVLEAAFEDGLTAQLNRTVVATLQRARDIDPSDVVTEAATEETLKKLEALGYITPDNPDAHNNLGQRYMETGEYERAIDEFEKALAINPDFPSALNNLGVCYGHLKRYEQAERSFRRALELHPTDVQAMNNLAIMFLQLGQTERAAEFGRQAVTVEPNYANGRVTLGSILATMGRLEEAEKQFQMALSIDPGNRNAQSNLERVRVELKK